MKLERIFVCKQGGIGDVVLLTPLLASLKKKYPHIKISLMTFPNAVDAVKGLPFIDEIFSYDKKNDNIWKYIYKIWKYDAALLFDLQYRPAILAFLAGIPIRIGIQHKRGLWLTHSVPWELSMDHRYEPYVFADMLGKKLGIELPQTELDTLYFAKPTQADEQVVATLFAEHGLTGNQPYVTCSPITAFHLKDWPPDYWRQLFQKVYDQYKLPVVIFGSAENGHLWNFPGAINVCGKTTLLQAASIIQHATLLINSCSLPIHIAAAFGTPCVALYGYSDYKRWAPKKNCVVVSANLPCSPCDGYVGSRCQDAQCMQQITVDDVFVACSKFL